MNWNFKMNIVRSLFVLAVLLAPSYAIADITITPTRIVFEDGDRFSEVTLINITDEQKTYKIGWQFMKMVEGNPAPYISVDESITDFDLTEHIVYTPRRVTLAPGAKQKIRLALRRPANVPAGEYRAHLAFSSVRDEAPDENPGDLGPSSSKFGVKISIGYSIPVIFRAGTPDVVGTIEGVAFRRNEQNGKLHALVTLGRSGGSYGVLGHLYLYDGNNKLIGEIGNAHIFPEVGRRVLDVPLADDDLSGSLRVVLARYDKAGAGNYDEKTFPVR